MRKKICMEKMSEDNINNGMNISWKDNNKDNNERYVAEENMLYIMKRGKL